MVFCHKGLVLVNFLIKNRKGEDTNTSASEFLCSLTFALYII